MLGTKEKCPYCQFPPEGCGKDFMAQLGFKEECMVISEHKGHFYIACTTNDTGDAINGIQERFSVDINYCPMCRRKLTKNEN